VNLQCRGVWFSALSRLHTQKQVNSSRSGQLRHADRESLAMPLQSRHRITGSKEEPRFQMRQLLSVDVATLLDNQGLLGCHVPRFTRLGPSRHSSTPDSGRQDETPRVNSRRREVDQGPCVVVVFPTAVWEPVDLMAVFMGFTGTDCQPFLPFLLPNWKSSSTCFPCIAMTSV